MTPDHIHHSPEIFTAPFTGRTLYFNPHPTQFCMVRSPALVDIRAAIETYVLERNEEHWEWLMQTLQRRPRTSRSLQTQILRIFHADGNHYYHINSQTFGHRLNEKSEALAPDRVAQLSLQEQGELANKIKPATAEETETLYVIREYHPVGYQFLTEQLNASNDASAFFNRLISFIYESLPNEAASRGGKAKNDVRRSRALDMLGVALAQGWLLMPLIFRASGLQEHYVFSHFQCFSRWFNKRYRGDSFDGLIDLIKTVPAVKTSSEGREHILRNLMVASTYRRLEDTCPDMLFRVGKVMDDFDSVPMSRQTKGMVFQCYNLLINFYNALPQSQPKFNVLVLPRKNEVTLKAYGEFAFLKTNGLEQWAQLLESNFHTYIDNSHQERRRAFSFLGRWLLTLTNPPLLPEDLPRPLVNDFQDDTNTLRNFIRANASVTNSTRLLSLIAKFFDWRLSELQRLHKGDLSSLPRMQNPIDLRFDTLKQKDARTGTHRKAIHSTIMEMMRSILQENDWAWPKSVTPYCYGHFPDFIDGGVSHVWCPSTAVMLFTILTVPIRGLQAQLLDSGEGDANIYDLSTGKMVSNPNRLPVDGRIQTSRREGLLQLQPSGVPGIPDVVGLWISTNKTSDEGYFIPWTSQELLNALQMQYAWIRRYAPHPDVRGRSAALSKTKATPIEAQRLEQKFFCLFRDPSCAKEDAHAPAAKHRLYKLWAKLCAETEKRINERAKNEHERIRLVDDINAEIPKARFDIHSLRVSGITDLLERGVPLNIVSEYVAGHATYMMTLWYDKPSAWQIRQHIEAAKQRLGSVDNPIPIFTTEEIETQKQYLVTQSTYAKKGLYTGYDALTDNKGLAYFKLSGICPGTDCDEGALDDHGRAAPVPRGDRGPSCPQCRFFLTGPAFLLGQMIEGNRLILKIRRKVENLHLLRNQIMDAEDTNNSKQADLLIGQVQVEELKLSDMVVEWWHRVQLFQASMEKLDDYELAKAGGSTQIRQALITKGDRSKVQSTITECTDIELKLFLSTCCEILPEFRDTEDSSQFDIETAIGKFLAVNDERMLADFFQLTDKQRHCSANLMMSTVLEMTNPTQAEKLLAGDLLLKQMPELTSQLASMLEHSSSQRFIASPGLIPVTKKA